MNTIIMTMKLKMLHFCLKLHKLSKVLLECLQILVPHAVDTDEKNRVKILQGEWLPESESCWQDDDISLAYLTEELIASQATEPGDP